MGKKNFIRDNGKVRNCDKNRAMMNVFEYWWYLERQGFWGRFFEGFAESFRSLGVGLALLLFLITIPISYPVFIWFVIRKKIKRAKEEIKFWGE
jgi:hypothetical protein